MRSWNRWVIGSLVCLALTVVLAASAGAQDYFGQNKVRYQPFDFKVLKTEHFDVYYYPEEAAVAPEAARMAERWYARYQKAFQHDLTRRQPLILYASHPAFEQTNAIEGDLSGGVGGVTEALKHRIVLPLAGPMAETDHVIGHELVHAFQYDIVGQGRTQSVGLSTAARLPLWFMEGMAEYMSLGADDPHTAMWMRSAVSANKLPDYNHLDDARYFPYRYGQAFWAYLTGRFGPATVGRILKAAGRNGDVRMALKSTLGVSGDSLALAWHHALRDWEAPVAKETETPRLIGQPLVLASRTAGHMNLAPSLSPDGRRVVFFSERSQFSIEMYVADAATGRVLRAITKSAVDPHYQSLEFISSAGEWSPDGKRFAFTGASRGRPALLVTDMEKGRLLLEKRFRDLGEIFSPTWSPDGQRIAFSALVGGVTDLFVLDLATGQTRRLTQDDWADLEPAWSPDGHSIAFVTDRYGAEGTERRFGHYHLALIDPESGAIRELATFPGATKDINPQWSPDGRSLYFVSDRGGISNLYRMELASGQIRQLTNLLTGVSGLTSLSPAFSVARDSGQLVYSTYEASSFEIFRLDAARRDGGTAPDTLVADAAELPPQTRERPVWADSVRTELAEVDTMQFSTVPYRPHFSIDYVAQPSLGIGAGSSGVAVGGGAGIYWSDMLGDRQLATLLQFANVGGNVLNNTAAAVAYQNVGSRWNWGYQLSQIPYITTGFSSLVQNPDNPNQVQQQEIRYWEIYRDVVASTAYPFSRFQRVEFSGGFRNISFAQQLETWTYDINTGAQVSDVKQDLPTPAALNLATGGTAVVYDNSVFGGTSPVLGQRYRLEVDETAGSLQMHEVLADYRRYVRLARALTLAGRVMHYGRYGPGSDDDRLSPLFVGYPWLVRGYDDTSYGNQITNAGDSLRYAALVNDFNDLVGSRLAVANVELRVPLLGALGLYQSPSVPPIETALFFDAGTAWDRNSTPQFLGGGRRPVSSYGVAFRANLFGFAVGEADLVHPNDRPGQSWYWELSIQPGF